MAVIRDIDDPARSRGNESRFDSSSGVCGWTLTNRNARRLGSGRAVIFNDVDAENFLDVPEIRRHIVAADIAGNLVIDRANPRFGERCGYWFGVFPSFLGANEAPMAFTLNVLERDGIVTREVAMRIYDRQRTAAERASDVRSMDRSAAEADRHDREYADRQPSFWDDLFGEARGLWKSLPVVGVVAIAVGAFLLLRS